MIKVFISQPMRDKTDTEIKEERERIINACKNKYGEIEVIDSFFESAIHALGKYNKEVLCDIIRI